MKIEIGILLLGFGTILVTLLFNFGIIGGNAVMEEKEIDDRVIINSDILEYGNSAVINIWIEGKQRLDKLRENNMKYLFVDVGNTDLNGNLITPEDEIQHFLDLIEDYERETSYYFILLPYSELNTDKYDFTSIEFQNNFFISYRKLVDMGFDGVYVDIEPVKFDERAEYLIFMEKLGKEFDDVIVSSYAGHFYDSKTNPYNWDEDFYRGVSNRVDLIFIGFYDSGSRSEEEYKSYVRNQLRQIAEEDWNSYFVFGAPTHKSDIETIESALEIYYGEIGKYESNRFIGVSIFAEWTTEEWEWEIIGKSL